jgi:hypothetical protein
MLYIPIETLLYRWLRAQAFPTLITYKKEYTPEIEERNNIPLVIGLNQSTYSLTAHLIVL